MKLRIHLSKLSLIILLFFNLIVLSQPNPNEITSNSSTNEVAYHLGYYDLYNRLQGQIEEKLNKMQDENELVAENFEAKGQFETSALVKSQAQEKYDDLSSYFGSLFDSIDSVVVLQGEALDQTITSVDTKINLIQNAIKQLKSLIAKNENY